jgi:1,4-dihydroxy-2-naphthoyl-CoA synthase
MATRSPDEIRGSIERTRHDLAVSVEDLRAKVQYLTDWRRQVREHRTAVIVATTVAGFAIGGGIAAMIGRRRRSR